MKTLKHSPVAALVLIGLLVSSNAQDAKNADKGKQASGPAITDHRVIRLGDELKLSENQKTKVGAVFEAEAKQIHELRNASNLTPAQRRERLAAMREESTKTMKQVLTSEQFLRWQESRQDRGRVAEGVEGNVESKKDK